MTDVRVREALNPGHRPRDTINQVFYEGKSLPIARTRNQAVSGHLQVECVSL